MEHDFESMLLPQIVNGRVTNIQLMKRNSWRDLLPSSPGQIIQNVYFVAPFQKGIHHVGSNKASPSGYYDAHAVRYLIQGRVCIGHDLDQGIPGRIQDLLGYFDDVVHPDAVNHGQNRVKRIISLVI